MEFNDRTEITVKEQAEYEKSLKRFDIALNGASALSLTALITVFGYGFIKGNISNMAVGSIAFAIVFLIRGLMEPVKQMTIIGPHIDRISMQIKEAAAQVCPENYSLTEACNLLENMLQAEDGKDYICVQNSAIYREALSEYAKALIQYDEVKRFIITQQAVDGSIVSIDPEEYDNGLRLYLIEMQKTLRYGPGRVSIIWDDVIFHELNDFTEKNREMVNQMRYNLKQMYAVTKERKEEKYKRNFEELMADSWLSAKKTD